MAEELADRHLADLHARAAELGVEGFRLLRREALIEAIGAAAESRPEVAEPEAEARDEPLEPPEAELSEDERAEADTDELAIAGPPLVEDDEESGQEEPEAEAEPEPEATGEAAEAEPTEPEAEPEEPEAAPRPREAEEGAGEVSGVLELTRQRFGFLRIAGLEPSPEDVYISASQVRRCELRPGDEVAGPSREPRRGERHRALTHVDRVNGVAPPGEERPEFDSLAAILPERRVPLDADRDDVLARAVDLLAPLALGQRMLIRAAPRSGRTTLLRAIGRAAEAAEGVRLIVLLVDERPEEATAWRQAVPEAEFAIATAELPPRDQLHVAELALERARRLAEAGEDAVLLCDSLSRLAFAAGGGDEVKRLFGSGRKLDGAGSLTVAATTVADSRDGGEAERVVATTESSLVTLDPELAAAGVVPALRAAECRVSNEDQLRDPEELTAIRRLRTLLADLESVEAARLLRERIEGSASNAELLAKT